VAKTIWLTSRSTFEKGAGFCPMFRYNRNHAGPYGYGWEPKAQSVPLSTGSYVHAGPEVILTAIMGVQQTAEGVARLQAIPWDAGLDQWYQAVVRAAVDHAAQKYESVIRARGFLNEQQQEEESIAYTMILMREQQTLIEGLTWAWALYVLPGLVQRGKIIAVEQPEFTVLGCTCQAGPTADLQTHADRDCDGIGFLAKLDFLLERFEDGGIEYHEFKTSGYGRKNWQEQWERKPQIQTSMLAAERRLDRPVHSAYVHGLLKGKRDRDRDTNYQGPKKQMTFFCYAYYLEPNPPLTEGDWQPKYERVDPDGNRRRLTKGYKKQPIWEVGPRGSADPRFPNKPQLATAPDGSPVYMANAEYWVRLLPVELVSKGYQLVGPIPRDPDKIGMAVAAITAEERLWQSRLRTIYDYATERGLGWGDGEFQTLIQTVIPRAFNCDPFTAIPCDFVPLCYHHEGWQDPAGSGKFVYRRPHHAIELQQMIDRGLEPPAAGLAAEEDEGEEGEW
jgi:hypothetical protein